MEASAYAMAWDLSLRADMGGRYAANNFRMALPLGRGTPVGQGIGASGAQLQEGLCRQTGERRRGRVTVAAHRRRAFMLRAGVVASLALGTILGIGAPALADPVPTISAPGSLTVRQNETVDLSYSVAV